jgi:hypothetical protein
LVGTLLLLFVACSGSEFSGEPTPSGSSILPGMGPPDAGNDADASPAEGGAAGNPPIEPGIAGDSAGGEGGSDEPDEPGGAGGQPVVDPGCQALMAGCDCVNGRCGPGLACTSDNECIEVPEPIAHWPLNENAADVSGNAYNGLAMNGVVFDGTSANFNSVDSFIDISSFSNKFKEIIDDEVTVYIRVRASSWETDPILFGSGDAGEEPAQNGFWLMVTSAKATLDTETDTGQDNLVILGQTLALDTWHDLVFLINWDHVDLYHNGEWADDLPFTRIDPMAEHMQIGGWLTAESALDGAIDDVQVYDVLLADPQIAALPSRR